MGVTDLGIERVARSFFRIAAQRTMKALFHQPFICATGLLLIVGLVPRPLMAQTDITTTGGGVTTTGNASLTQPGAAPAAGSTASGLQPSSPTSNTFTQAAPTTVQLGSSVGLGGGIRPPLMTPTPGQPLTLDQAVTISLANNLNIYTALSLERQARFRVAETKTGFLPHISGTGTYTYTGEVNSANISGKTVVTGTHNQYTGAASVTQPIDLSGSLRATQGIAEAERDAQYWALDSSRRQVILTTASAYLAVLRAAALVGVQQQQLTDARAHVELSQKMLTAGTIARYDLLVTQTALANAQQAFVSAQTAYNQSIAQLDNALGISQETNLTLPPLPPPGPGVPDFAPSLAVALKNRPELQQIDANVRSAQQSVRLAKTGTLPSLGLQANYTYTGITTGFSSLHKNWTVGVVGSWSPFDWGATRDRANEAQENVTTNRYLEEQTRQGIEFQVRQAINAISDALQRRQAALIAVTQAQEQLRLANVRFGAGAGTNTDVLDAEAALAQARSNEEGALYDEYTAVANYQRATGTEPLAAEPLPITPPSEPGSPPVPLGPGAALPPAPAANPRTGAPRVNPPQPGGAGAATPGAPFPIPQTPTPAYRAPASRTAPAPHPVQASRQTPVHRPDSGSRSLAEVSPAPSFPIPLSPEPAAPGSNR